MPQHVHGVEELGGGSIAVRSSGQPHAVTLWLKMLGLENDVVTVLVDDQEVGRWGQWKKVASGDCIASFMSPLYLPQALAAGLTVLAAPEIPIIGPMWAAAIILPRLYILLAATHMDAARSTLATRRLTKVVG